MRKRYRRSAHQRAEKHALQICQPNEELRLRERPRARDGSSLSADAQNVVRFCGLHLSDLIVGVAQSF